VKTRGVRFVVCLASAGVLFLVVAAGWLSAGSHGVAAVGASIPVGVLGDSDSHAFQDMLSFPPGSARRGGRFRATTFQWTEVLARMRAEQLDFGPWGEWGSRGSIARVREWLGRDGRAPRKQDYQYNFARSGAGCDELMSGGWRQAPRLVGLMDRDPARWQKGLVVIRIGVNSFGLADSLDLLARDSAAAEVQATISDCVAQIRAAVGLIHARHPQTRIVVVGILDNAHWPPYFDRWQSSAQLSRITAGLDRFDSVLRELAAHDPRLAFFDDRAWFAQRWGARDARGQPDYKTVSIGPRLSVSNTSGDDPSHSVVADGHAGVVWNTLWAQSLLALVNTSFGMNLTPITDAQVQRFLEPALSAPP
jgi:hypothetical protein